MMATSHDQEAALAQGINVGRIFGLVWLIAGILGGFAGFFITGGFNTLTQASFISALRALPAVVIGGLDSITGAVVGSLSSAALKCCTAGSQRLALRHAQRCPPQPAPQLSGHAVTNR